MYRRYTTDMLVSRLRKGRGSMQIVVGCRQSGKTTTLADYVADATPRALRSELIIASTSRASASASAASDAVVSGHSPG